VRATTLVSRLLDLPGITVTGVSLEPATLLVQVRLKARKLHCPLCEYSTWARYDQRPVPSRWRHLDFGTSMVVLRAERRRLRCPEHGVVTEWAPFARYRAGFRARSESTTQSAVERVRFLLCLPIWSPWLAATRRSGRI
jgi:transposase